MVNIETDEEIVVKFVMGKNGKIKKIKDKNGKDAPDESPKTDTKWASAMVTTKDSPGKIYIWIGKWVCIQA